MGSRRCEGTGETKRASSLWPGMTMKGIEMAEDPARGGGVAFSEGSPNNELVAQTGVGSGAVEKSETDS